MNTHTADCAECDFRVSAPSLIARLLYVSNWPHRRVYVSAAEQTARPRLAKGDEASPVQVSHCVPGHRCVVCNSLLAIIALLGLTRYVFSVSTLRGDTWLPANLEGTEEQKEAWGEESIIEGHIDQVIF